MTEQLRFHFSLSCIEEGNGNPLQCSCLENPRDQGAWWAAVYGVARSRTQLKWLCSSNIARLISELKFLKTWRTDNFYQVRFFKTGSLIEEIVTVKTLGLCISNNKKISVSTLCLIWWLHDPLRSPPCTFLLCRLTITRWQLHLQASHVHSGQERERGEGEKCMPSDIPALYQEKSCFPEATK